MTIRTLTALKNMFLTGLKPTQVNFADTIDTLANSKFEIDIDTLAKGPGMVEFPIVAGLPESNITSGTLVAGELDSSPFFNHAFYLARKAGPEGLTIKVNGTRTVRSVLCMPNMNMTIETNSHNTAQIIYDGATGTDFFVGGNAATAITRLPATFLSTGSGRTTFSIGATGHAFKTSNNLAGSWINLDYTNQAGEAVTVDTWGQWLAMFKQIGITDGTNYALLSVFSADIAARTITVTGTIGFTASHIHGPGLNGGGTSFIPSANNIHPLAIRDTLRNLTFQCRDKGKVLQNVQRGLKGSEDTAAIWESVFFRKPHTIYMDFDSDTTISGIEVAQFTGPLSLTAVDSTVGQILVRATQLGGMDLLTDWSDTYATGKWKVYYPSQNCTLFDDAFGVRFATGMSGFHSIGSMIINDNAGPCLRVQSGVSNITLQYLVLSNPGSMNRGAPSTVGPAWDCDGIFIEKNGRVGSLNFVGIMRGNPTNRDGFHMRSLLYIERPTSKDPGQGAPMPWLIENVIIDIESRTQNYSQAPLYKTPDIRKPLWSAIKADYLTSDIVQIADTAYDPRYQPLVNNPTVGVSPVGSAQWKQVGGGENTWRQAFIEELLAPTSGSYEFCEFSNVTLILDGERDPSYHQRIISGRPAFTVDPEHDLVQATSGAAAESRFDVFFGREGKEQIWRGLDAASGKPFILQPGYRNNGSIAGREATVPFIAGATWTVRRVNGEFRTAHRAGKVWPVEHLQLEELGDVSTLTVDLADYGHTLILGTTVACTVTMPTIANMPAGYWVRLVMTGAGTVPAIAGVTGMNTLAMNGTLTIRKTAAGYKGFAT